MKQEQDIGAMRPEENTDKRPWETPRILSREEFEINAAICDGDGASGTKWDVACTGGVRS